MPPGFAQHELHRLGLLVLGHRGKLRKLEADLDDRGVRRTQLFCLRLAVILCHARRDPDLHGLHLQAGPGPFRLAHDQRTGHAPIPNRRTCCARKPWPGRRRPGRCT